MLPFYYLGNMIWRLVLSMTGISSVQTPVTFSEGAWEYVSGEVYPLFAAVGATLLNIFFYVGVIRQTGNLKQNLTLETFVELCIKAVVCNAALQMGLTLMRWCFGVAKIFSAAILIEDPDISFALADMNAGAAVFYMVWGIVYLVVCLITSVTVFLTVYGRFLQLYLLVCAYPLAVSTMPGGPGISQTASAWLKTFLAKNFGIIAILLAVAIASKICSSVYIDFSSVSGVGGVTGEMLRFTDGAAQGLRNMFTMVLLAASVKGTDMFMKRAFAL